MENEKTSQENPDNESEAILDDDYLLQLHHCLQEMKKTRKKAEQDANLLDGRLRCLRGEEEKTLKKIEVTRRKTENKTSMLQQQEEDYRRKADFINQKKEELMKKKEQTQMQKESNKMAILVSRDEKKRNIESEIKQLKDQKKNNEELRKYIEIEELSNKKTQADYIKSQQIIAEEKRRAIELEKKSKIKLDLELKIIEEEAKIKEADMKKQLLESEEIEIMKKIKTTTQIHEAMIENYEKLGNSKQATSKK